MFFTLFLYKDALRTGTPERGAFVFYDCLCAPAETGLSVRKVKKALAGFLYEKYDIGASGPRTNQKRD